MRETLSRIHTILMNRIQKAAEAGKTEEVLMYTTMLQKTKSLQDSYSKLKREIDELVQLVEKGDVSMEKHIEHRMPPQRVSEEPNRMAKGRLQGKRARDYFLRLAEGKGIQIPPQKRAIHRTSEGMRIALLYSKDHGGTWFFGIKDQPLDAVVFLCGTASPDEFRSFVLPGDEYERRRPHFSRSGTELKFNLREVGGGNVEMQLADRQYDVYLTKYEDDLSSIR